MSVSATAENPLIVTGKDGDVLAYRHPNLQYSPMGMFIIYRLLKNRDIKAIVTSKGTTTGTGKTWLTIQLSRWCARVGAELFNREYEWTAEDFAFMDVWEYIDKYENADSGEVLITDEIQTQVDKRRSMSHENVEFSHVWQEYRWKNVVTWATAPNLHNPDKRIKENTDIWINVLTQGKANVYLLTMDDFIERLIYKRFKRSGFRQSLLFLPPPGENEDPDYQYLHNLKKSKDRKNFGQKLTENDIKKARTNVIEQFALNILEMQNDLPFALSQEEICNNLLKDQNGDAMRSQQWLSKLKRENDL